MLVAGKQPSEQCTALLNQVYLPLTSVRFAHEYLTGGKFFEKLKSPKNKNHQF